MVFQQQYLDNMNYRSTGHGAYLTGRSAAQLMIRLIITLKHINTFIITVAVVVFLVVVIVFVILILIFAIINLKAQPHDEFAER